MAWELEKGQIESALSLQAFVSLTDHDCIEAPVSLRLLGEWRDAPVSVEWTAPFGGTFFHFGVHNLPPAGARRAMQAMAEYTASPADRRLGEILEWFSGNPQTLVVFNHPLWDENEVGSRTHRHAAAELLRRYGTFIHALELNGLRPWGENLMVVEWARAWRKPAVSGGDRHGLEPNALLNLSHAATFAEFVEEIRRDARSEICIMPNYLRPLSWRVFDTVLDIVGDHEIHGLGWKRWDERVFYRYDDGTERSLRDIWKGEPPAPVRAFTALARALYGSWIQRTLRATVAGQGEFAL